MEKELTGDTELTKTLEHLFVHQEKNIERAVSCLKVLAHPIRLKIVCVLRTGEHTVQDLERYVGVAQATVSQHLALLKSREIVTSRRERNYSLYRIADDNMVKIFELIKTVFCDMPNGF